MAINKDLKLIAPDGDEYVFLGMRWRNLRTGRMASAEMEMALETLAIKNQHIYGENIFSDLLQQAVEHNLMPERAKISLDWVLERNKQTREWTRNQARRVNKSGANLRSEMFSDSDLKRVNTPEIGKMYLYIYDSKLYKENQIPYFDAFPAIFCIEKYTGKSRGHLGINLHYLPFVHRSRVMDALYRIKSNRYMNEKTKLIISYDILNSSAKFKGFKPCIHRYLADSKYTKSVYLEVPPHMWSFVMFLPLQRFVGASAQKVWKDSLKRM